ncbi:cytochrome c3 family protein [Sandarakinorhabdus sp.]|uniref:cytochrome c3 family protein n=1 Tax=Sandarakinorhabdus sp. TaxID=1916663 RepID=UPI00333F6F1B
MPRPATLVMAAALIGVILLAILYPQPMLAPGPVMPAHAAIAGDCFACHTPFQGAAAPRCITCHVPARIGLFTTTGKRLAGGKAAFHQQLANPDCMACHSDHAGPALTGHSPTSFHHDLLRPAVRGQCAACHVPPATTLHRQFGTANCGSCHNSTSWKPARFAHDRLFRLDGEHAVACATCHTGGNLKQYSCYGCHAHQPAQVLAEHREEGVRGNIDKCARCHRSAEGEGEDEDDG